MVKIKDKELFIAWTETGTYEKMWKNFDTLEEFIEDYEEWNSYIANNSRLVYCIVFGEIKDFGCMRGLYSFCKAVAKSRKKNKTLSEIKTLFDEINEKLEKIL